MNIVTLYNGFHEIVKHYNVHVSVLGNKYTEGHNRALSDPYLGMMPEKYIRVATKGIKDFKVPCTMLLFDNIEDCIKAVRNLNWYLVNRDYE
jgi:hypothetical protein